MLRQDRPLQFRGRKAMALLAYLAVEWEQRHSRSSLLGLFWPDMGEAEARNNLRVVLAGLRRQVRPLAGQDPILESTRQEIWFNHTNLVQSDVVHFQQLLAKWDLHTHEERGACAVCQALLVEAADLYRGEFLSGFYLDDCPAFDEWLFVRREGWHLQMMEILGELSSAYELTRDYKRAELYTRRWLALDKLQEEAHRQLMRLLVYQGQRPAALAQYETCHRILREDLGVDPDPDTVWLYQQIKAGNLEPPVDVTPETAAIPPRYRIPVTITPFIGRETELAQLGRRLSQRQYRLITIVGLGGIGKTRLAIQAARDNQHLFADGVYFLSLARLETVDEILGAILAALDVPSGAGRDSPKQVLLRYLRNRNLLLVIDNLDHLMDGVALILEILQAAPEVMLLVTSREELLLQAADLFLLSGLPTPESADVENVTQYAAVRLFADRAKRIDKTFRLDSHLLADVVEICHLVEGLPLGIELAAAAVQDFSCREIADKLASGLEILSTSARDVSPQHRSMQAAFDYSWGLLSRQEQMALAQLSVFRGGFSPQAAKSVTGASRHLISQLRYKSLVRSRGAGRFDLHIVIQQLALERLEALSRAGSERHPDAIRARHCHYFLRFLAENEEALNGWEPNQALQTLSKDLDNLRQAWQFALDHEFWPSLLAAVQAMARYYSLAGLYMEGEHVFKASVRFVERARREKQIPPDTLIPLHARLLYALVICLQEQIKISESELILPQLVELSGTCDDTYSLAYAHLQLGANHLNQGDSGAAWPHLQRGLTIASEHGHPRLQGIILRAIGNVWRQRGDYGQFENNLLRALEIQEAAQNAAEVQTIKTWLGVYRRDQGDVWGGRHWLEEAERLNAQVGDRYREATILMGLAIGDLDIGRYAPALTLMETARQIYEDINDQWHIAWSLTYIALAHFYLGEYETAIDQAGRSIELAREEEMGEVIARSTIVLAFALLESDEYERATDLFRRADKRWQQIGNPRLRMQVLAGLGELALRQGRPDQASAHIEPVVVFMEENDLFGSVDPFRIYWSCYQILEANQDGRGRAVLRRAYEAIRAQAEKITDPAAASSYLENVLVHRNIVAACKN